MTRLAFTVTFATGMVFMHAAVVLLVRDETRAARAWLARRAERRRAAHLARLLTALREQYPPAHADDQAAR
jgi:hypothetical protein